MSTWYVNEKIEYETLEKNELWEQILKFGFDVRC